jgi:hypothetical protein
MKSCTLTKALAKFPDNAREMELLWLDKSYVDLNVSNKDIYIKVRKYIDLCLSLTMFKISLFFSFLVEKISSKFARDDNYVQSLLQGKDPRDKGRSLLPDKMPASKGSWKMVCR